MVVYVAFIAILNLGLGYALAVYLGKGRRPTATQDVADQEASYSAEYDSDEYEYDDSYEHVTEDDEYESAVS